MRHNQLLKALCHHGWQCYQFLFMDACHLALRGHQYYQYTFTTLDLNGERLKITAKSPDSLSEQILRVWSGVLSGPDIVQGFTFAKDLLTLASVNKITVLSGVVGTQEGTSVSSLLKQAQNALSSPRRDASLSLELRPATTSKRPTDPPIKTIIVSSLSQWPYRCSTFTSLYDPVLPDLNT